MGAGEAHVVRVERGVGAGHQDSQRDDARRQRAAGCDQARSSGNRRHQSQHQPHSRVDDGQHQDGTRRADGGDHQEWDGEGGDDRAERIGREQPPCAARRPRRIAAQQSR